jgi:hypothetical protein
MRIWLIHEDFTVMGGAQKFCAILVDKLKQKHAVTIITPKYIKEKTWVIYFFLDFSHILIEE